MPLYDYKCGQCGHIFEVMQKITEEPLKFCPECKGPIKRLISAAGIIFKGTGFHVTDYKTKTTDHRPQTKDHSPKADDQKPKTETKETKSSAGEPAPKTEDRAAQSPDKTSK